MIFERKLSIFFIICLIILVGLVIWTGIGMGWFE